MVDPTAPPATTDAALLGAVVSNPTFGVVFATSRGAAAWSTLASDMLERASDGKDGPRDAGLAAIALARLGFIDLACSLDRDFGRERDLRAQLVARPPGESVFVIRIGEGGISEGWPTLQPSTPLAAPPNEAIDGLGTWTDKQFFTVQAEVAKARDRLRGAQRWVLDIGTVSDAKAAVKPLEKLVTFDGVIGLDHQSLAGAYTRLDARTPTELVAALRTPRQSAK